MHNRIKGSNVLTAEQHRQQSIQRNKYNQAKHKVLQYKHSGVYTVEALKYTEILLNINPDLTTIWNYRLQIIQSQTFPVDYTNELTITEHALHINSKCYTAWYYRLCVIDLGRLDCNTELQLCNKFIELDQRNFHCWNYRRSICTRIDTQQYINQQYMTNNVYQNIELIESEYNYTAQCINHNFSNYSAWHYRSQLLLMCKYHQLNHTVHGNKLLSIDYIKLLSNDYKYIKRAILTEPTDQSAWLYHRWLVTQSMILCTYNIPDCGIVSTIELQQHNTTQRGSNSTTIQLSTDELCSILRDEINVCTEVLQLDPQCKYAIITQSMLYAALHYYTNTNSNHNDILSQLDRLPQLDPPRTNYYKHLTQQLKRTIAPQ